MSNPSVDNDGPRDEPTGEVRHDATPPAPELATSGFEPLPAIDVKIPNYARTKVSGVRLIYKTDRTITVQRPHHLSRPATLRIDRVTCSVNGQYRRPEFVGLGETLDVLLPVWLYRKIYKAL